MLKWTERVMEAKARGWATDQDILDASLGDTCLVGEAARVLGFRGADAEYEARGLTPVNGWHSLQLNKKSLADMGRDSKGAPLPPRVKK